MISETSIQSLIDAKRELLLRVADLDRQIDAARRSCEHDWAKDRYHAICGKCGLRQRGWWCPTSPDRQCHYTKYGEDYCDYCGKPDERK